MIRLIVLLLVALSLTAPIAGCGKKGDLDAPEEEKVKYPRQYPR